MRNVTLIVACLTLGSILMLGGCKAGTFVEKAVVEPAEPEMLTTVQYNSNAMQNYYLGRQLVASGRYELAREHYLLALASANQEAMRQTLSNELESVDRLIKTLR